MGKQKYVWETCSRPIWMGHRKSRNPAQRYDRKVEAEKLRSLYGTECQAKALCSLPGIHTVLRFLRKEGPRSELWLRKTDLVVVCPQNGLEGRKPGVENQLETIPMLPCLSGNTIYKLKWWQEEWKKKQLGGALQSGNELGLAYDLGCPGKKGRWK